MVVHVRTLWFGLYLDDNHHARPWRLTEVLQTFAGPFDPLRIEPDYYRPLAVVTFKLDWMAWGYGTVGYHLTNLALHVVVVVLLARLLFDLTSSLAAAIAGASFFAVIPANVPTVVYISERSDSLVAIFVLIASRSALRYAARPGRGHLMIMLGSFVGALLSKEIGLSLAGLVCVVWLFAPVIRREPSVVSTSIVSSETDRASPVATIRAQIAKRSAWLPLVIGLSGLAVGYLAYRSWVLPGGHATTKYGSSGPIQSWVSAVLWTLKGVAWELSARAFPVLLVALSMGLGMAYRSRGQDRSATLGLFLLGGLWILAACLPLAPLGRVEPRLLYVSQIGVALLISSCMCAVSAWWRERRRAMPLRLGFGGMAVALLGLTLVSVIEAQNEFRPGSLKMLGGDCRILFDPNAERYPEVRIGETIERLRKAGASDDPARRKLCADLIGP